MQAYYIKYQAKNSKWDATAHVDAKDVKSAKNKIERKVKAKIKILEVNVIGYY